MNDINMEERIAIRDSARSLKKYGSTSNYNCKRQEHFVKHQVKETDTLQGLALKYGVTTEEIRRANRLWANDSIFLRESLLIPSSSTSSSTTPSQDSGLSSPSNGQALLEEKGASQKNGDLDREDSYSDFLVKIDCAIASTKTQVITAQGNSEFLDDESAFWRRRPTGRLRRDSECSDGQSTGSSGSSRPSEVVVMTQGRRVRDSLQRLEKEWDEIFEL